MPPRSSGAAPSNKATGVFKRIFSLILDGRYEEARTLIESERKNYSGESHRFLAYSAMLHEELGETDAAIGLMRQAIQERPGFLPHLYKLSVMLMDVKRWGEAEIQLKDTIKLCLMHSDFYVLDDSRYRRAICLFRIGRMAEFEQAKAEIPPGTRIFLDDKHCEIDEFLK